MKISSINQGIDTDGLLIKETILCQPEFAAQISSAWFKPDFYAEYVRPVSQGGRNAAWFIDTTALAKDADAGGVAAAKEMNAVATSTSNKKCEDQTLPILHAVLRQYRRGGMVAKLSRSHYVWGGAEQTRSWMELRLLQQMYNAGLPVPRPLAAYYKQSLGFYKAAILTQTIPNSQPLVAVLQQSLDDDKLLTKLAGRVAKAIAAMHDFGVWHADLNAFNIMVDDQIKVWLLDFDKSRYRSKEKRVHDSQELAQEAKSNKQQANSDNQGDSKVDNKSLSKSERKAKCKKDKGGRQESVINWREDNLQRLQRHLIKTCGEQGLAFWSQINEKYQKI